MALRFGSGDYIYEPVIGWGRLPDGWLFNEVAAVGVDRQDNVYCFNRGEHPMMVFDRDGNFLRSWGEGLFSRAHGIDIDEDDILYCTDDGDHTVRKLTTDGKVLMTIGVPGKPARRDEQSVVPICVHGDAAFPGEGIVAETFNLAHLRSTDVGGTLHIIVNNQVGFTTNPTDSRSTRFASDLAKGFEMPIIHVNADDAEACVIAMRIAVAYRTTFGRDFLIDLVGYRRHGHFGYGAAGLLGGFALGALAASPAYYGYGYPAAYGYGYPAYYGGDCHLVRRRFIGAYGGTYIRRVRVCD